MAAKLGNRRLSALVTLVAMWCIVVGMISVAIIGGYGRSRSLSNNPQFRIVVTSGDAVIVRGETITLAGYLEALGSVETVSDAVNLVIHIDDNTPDLIAPMTADPSGAYYLTRAAVSASFQYRIEAHGVVSPWYTVTAADAVSLGAETVVRIQPPQYAERSASTGQPFASFDAVQFSTITIRFAFTEPVHTAKLEWLTTGNTRRTLPLKLNDERTQGNVTFELEESGTLQLSTVSKSTLTATTAVPVRSLPDQPPRFAKVIGLSGASREARPTDRIPIDLSIVDDWGVRSLGLEYRLNRQETAIIAEPLTLPGLGGPRAEGVLQIPLEGKVKEGDTFEFRLVAMDNRNVPARSLGSQRSNYPASGWVTVHVNSNARPLSEQDLIAQHDRVRDLATSVLKQTSDATAEIGAITATGIGDSGMSLDQITRVRTVLEKLTDTRRGLEQFVMEFDTVGELQPIITTLRGGLQREAVARNLVVQLQRASKPADRDTALTAASAAIRDLGTQLQPLPTRNDRLLKLRLDLQNLRHIHAEQLALVKFAATPDGNAEELIRRQEAIRNQLAGTISTSDVCRQAIAAYSQQEIQQLSDRTRTLLAEQKRLNLAMTDWQTQTQQAYIADLVRQERDLIRRIEALAKTTTTAARLAQTTALWTGPFEHAAEILTQGQVIDALAEQEKAAAELDHFADKLNVSIQARRDRREAMLQLARWQDDIRRRYADAVKQGTTKIPAATWQAFEDEQRVLARVIAPACQLVDGPTPGAASKAAMEACNDVTTALHDARPDTILTLQRAVERLNMLADKLPSNAERLKLAKTRLDQIRRDQEQLSRDVEPILTAHGQNPAIIPAAKLTRFVSAETKLVEQLQELDLFDAPARQGVAVVVGFQTIADLQQGLPFDIAVSLQEMRRQLDRLRQVLEHQTPTDDHAVQLLERQGEVLERLQALPDPPRPDDLQTLRQQQREINRQLATLQVVGTSGLYVNAVDQAQSFENALRRAEPLPQLRTLGRDTQTALALLTARLTGTESEQARVQRMYRDRVTQVERAKVAAKQPYSAESTAEGTRHVQRQIEELELTRVGLAQAAKRKVMDALQRLRTAPEPDRQLTMQLTAAEAFQKLADEMVKNADRTNTLRFVGPQMLTEAQQLQELNGRDYLPNAKQAETARQLARDQRRIRNDSAEITTLAQRLPKAMETDPIGDLANVQRELVTKSRSWPASAKTDSWRTHAQDMIEHLNVGAIDAAIPIAKSALADLNAIPDRNDVAATQASLNAKLEQHRTQRVEIFTRQARRQKELSQDATQLAEAMRAWKDGSTGIGLTDDSPFTQATVEAEKVATSLTEAIRETTAERGGPSRDARVKATVHLEKAVELLNQLRPKSGTLVVDDIAPPQVGAALRQTEASIQQALRELTNPDTQADAKKSLNNVATQLQLAMTHLCPTLPRK